MADMKPLSVLIRRSGRIGSPAKIGARAICPEYSSSAPGEPFFEHGAVWKRILRPRRPGEVGRAELPTQQDILPRDENLGVLLLYDVRLGNLWLRGSAGHHNHAERHKTCSDGDCQYKKIRANFMTKPNISKRACAVPD
ncbi:hypothetical protein QW131_28035 [Roseibium salinum]|nr:hypothetical protein [Roseibium salinum]